MAGLGTGDYRKQGTLCPESLLMNWALNLCKVYDETSPGKNVDQGAD